MPTDMPTEVPIWPILEKSLSTKLKYFVPNALHIPMTTSWGDSLAQQEALRLGGAATIL
jgi:hypothetical protein